MGLYDFKKQQFISISDVPDNRDEAEKQLSPISVYNHSKSDLGYVERLGEELINISGAIVNVYLKRVTKMRQENETGILPKETFDEDVESVYSSAVIMKAFFKPPARQIDLTKFGVDIANMKMEVTFSRALLLLHPKIGDRLLVPGDVIEIPYNHITEKHDPLYLRVNSSTPAGNYHYRFIYHQCTCDIMPYDESLKVKHR